MAETATFDTYRAVGIREDLIDDIYNIAPTDTPFVSNVASGTSKGTFHEWQKDTLEAPSNSPVAEGADASAVELDPTVRLGNYCQINEETFRISGSDLKADNAGRGTDLSYHEMKKGIKLRKDIELRCVAVNASRAAGAGNNPGAAVAREAAGVLSWISTNTNKAGDGADPSGDGTDARGDGTARTFTEDMLEDVIDKVYLAGGNPDIIMSNTVNKRIISSSFDGRASSVDATVTDKRIVNAVDFYESDYGVMSIVPNRYMRQRDVFVLDSDMWSVDYYRPFQTEELAKTGDNIKKQMLVEWTLRSKEESSGGGIFDLGA